MEQRNRGVESISRLHIANDLEDRSLMLFASVISLDSDVEVSEIGGIDRFRSIEQIIQRRMRT